MNDISCPVSEEKIAAVLQTLKKNEFLAYFVPNAREAKEMVLASVSPGMRVGLGGSETLREMGMPEAVNAAGAVPLDHWEPSLSVDASLQCRRDQLLCGLFLASVNAVTEAGELVSRDGIGNRISATAFGPKKVVLVVGVQKIVPDLSSAFQRIDEISPRRAKSLGLDLACAREGVCTDCEEPERICRATLVLHRRPLLTDITVILVGEPLGY
jgi:hypothetical protein